MSELQVGDRVRINQNAATPRLRGEVGIITDIEVTVQCGPRRYEVLLNNGPMWIFDHKIEIESYSDFLDKIKDRML